MANTSLKRRIEELERQPLATGPCFSPQFDEDALQLYNMVFELHGRVYPDSRAINDAPIGVRGKELARKKYGPIIPVHESPRWSRWTHASSEFEYCFGREPVE